MVIFVCFLCKKKNKAALTSRLQNPMEGKLNFLSCARFIVAWIIQQVDLNWPVEIIPLKFASQCPTKNMISDLGNYPEIPVSSQWLPNLLSVVVKSWPCQTPNLGTYLEILFLPSDYQIYYSQTVTLLDICTLSVRLLYECYYHY